MNFSITPAVPIQQVAPTPPATKKVYTGTYPKCITCGYHHLTTVPCRQCTNCNRLGHFATTCRLPTTPVNPVNVPLLPAPNAPPAPRVCYQCGIPISFSTFAL